MGSFGDFSTTYGEIHSKCAPCYLNTTRPYIFRPILKALGFQLAEISARIAVYKSHNASLRAKQEKRQKTKITKGEARR